MDPTPTRRNGTGSRWWFLDVGVHVLRDGDPTVMELHLPVGAAPPEHVHTGYDDSFLVLEGELVVRHPGVTKVVRAGDWVCSPAGTPHAFRVPGPDPARVLQVFDARSFLDLIIELGEPADAPGLPPAGRSPDVATVLAAFADHDVRVVGPPLGEAQARAHAERARRDRSGRRDDGDQMRA